MQGAGMLAEQFNAVLSGITGPVRSVTGSRPGGEPDIGDGLSTRLTVGEVRQLFEDWEVTMPDGEAYWSNLVSLHR